MGCGDCIVLLLPCFASFVLPIAHYVLVSCRSCVQITSSHSFFPTIYFGRTQPAVRFVLCKDGRFACSWLFRSIGVELIVPGVASKLNRKYSSRPAYRVDSPISQLLHNLHMSVCFYSTILCGNVCDNFSTF